MKATQKITEQEILSDIWLIIIYIRKDLFFCVQIKINEIFKMLADGWSEKH